MASCRTKGFAVAAALCGGLLAGISANRSLVQIPAWQRVGAFPWAVFTRAENHGLGALYYPLVGLAALVFAAATAVAHRFDGDGGTSRSFPIYAAAVTAIAWAAVTRGFVVPPLLKLRTTVDSTAELQSLFLSLARWWAINDVLHVVGFCFNLWAVAEVFSGPKRDAS